MVHSPFLKLIAGEVSAESHRKFSRLLFRPCELRWWWFRSQPPPGQVARPHRHTRQMRKNKGARTGCRYPSGDIRRKWGVFWRVFHMLASRCPLSLVVTLCNFLYFLLGSWGTAIGFDSISCHFWNQSGPIMSPPLKTVNSEVATTKVHPFRGF